MIAPTLTIFHNPRCSKSRQTLQLLQDNNHTPTVIEYLKTPPSLVTLKRLHQQLAGDARAMMRTKDALYKTLNLKDDTLSQEALLNAIHSNPALLERPIVFDETRAVIARPPENVLELLK